MGMHYALPIFSGTFKADRIFWRNKRTNQIQFPSGEMPKPILLLLRCNKWCLFCIWSRYFLSRIQGGVECVRHVQRVVIFTFHQSVQRVILFSDIIPCLGFFSTHTCASQSRNIARYVSASFCLHFDANSAKYSTSHL